jgi:membrane-associated protease RseP (regulator of RpoE activity)
LRELPTLTLQPAIKISGKVKVPGQIQSNSAERGQAMRILHTLLLVLVSAVTLLDFGVWSQKQGVSITTTISIGQDKHAEAKAESPPQKRGYIGFAYVKNTVTQVFAGSPAAKAGIMIGDKIMDIDGRSTFGMDSRGKFEAITGAVGTSVDVILERDDEQLKLSMVRALAVPDELEQLKIQQRKWADAASSKAKSNLSDAATTDATIADSKE